MNRSLPNLPIERLFDAIEITEQAAEFEPYHLTCPSSLLPEYLFTVWADEPNVAVTLIKSETVFHNKMKSELGFARANINDKYVYETGLKIALLRAAANFIIKEG